MSKLRIFACVAFMVSLACLSVAEPRAAAGFCGSYCDDVVECTGACGCTCDGTHPYPYGCTGLGYCTIMPEPAPK